MKRNRFTCTESAAVRYPAVLAHVNDAIRKGAFGAGTIQDAVCSDVELYDLDPGISCWKLGKSRSLYQWRSAPRLTWSSGQAAASQPRNRTVVASYCWPGRIQIASVFAL